MLLMMMMMVMSDNGCHVKGHGHDMTFYPMERRFIVITILNANPVSAHHAWLNTDHVQRLNDQTSPLKAIHCPCPSERSAQIKLIQACK